jgi:hypothetical protein
MNVFRRLAVGGGIVTVCLFSCAGGGGGGGIGGTGIIRLALTDAPACGYDAVNVTIDRLRVHQRADAGIGDSGWSEIVVSPPKRIDLLTLQNGALEPLGEAAVSAGHYAQVRMVLADNSLAAPLANSVVPTGQAEAPLDTQASGKNGIKIKLDATVEPEQIADVVLDFDACKSVVKAGNAGKYKLKPVITAIPLTGPAGQGVVGHVDPSLDMPFTRVSAQAGGVQVKATAPDASGRFVLYPVPIGRYDVVISAPGRVATVVSGVPVDGVAHTHLNDAAYPIVPGLLRADPRAVGGKVAPATATVRATQQLSGGPTIEVAFAPVDAKSGSYSTGLPLDAPWRATYAASPNVVIFSADELAAGQYSVEAQSDRDTRTRAIDVRQPVPPINFSFP